MNWSRAFPVFSIIFGVIYVPCMFFNLPVFTYIPKIKEYHWLYVQPTPAQGPGMYFYGWLLTAGIAASLIATASVALPERIVARLTPLTWVSPLVMLGVVLYILRDWFFR